MSIINDYGFPFTSQDGDRKYSALEWREYFSRLIHNGLIQNAANECQVKPQAAPNKTVYVDTGVVFINGAMRVLEEPVTLAVAENTSGNPRIDRVVARLNEASRTIEFDVLEGTPAGSPVAPSLTRNEGVYEMGLADITLANGYSTITSGIIADQRWNVVLCGASSMTIGVIPPSGSEAVTVTLSEETALKYGLSGPAANVDNALLYMPSDSSYISFCGNVNATMLDASFGKNNEDKIIGLGRQLAMFSWFKGDSKITYPYTNLIAFNSFRSICEDPQCLAEIIINSNIVSLINASPWAKAIYEAIVDLDSITMGKALAILAGKNPDNYADVTAIASDAEVMSILASSAALMAAICTSTVSLNAMIPSLVAMGAFYNNAAVTQPIILASTKAMAILTTNAVEVTSVTSPPTTVQEITPRKAFVLQVRWMDGGASTITAKLRACQVGATDQTLSTSGNTFANVNKFIDAPRMWCIGAGCGFTETSRRVAKLVYCS